MGTTAAEPSGSRSCNCDDSVDLPEPGGPAMATMKRRSPPARLKMVATMCAISDIGVPSFPIWFPAFPSALEFAHRRLGSVGIGDLHRHRGHVLADLEIGLVIVGDRVGILLVAGRHFYGLVETCAVEAVADPLYGAAVGQHVGEIDDAGVAAGIERDPRRPELVEDLLAA